MELTRAICIIAFTAFEYSVEVCEVPYLETRNFNECTCKYTQYIDLDYWNYSPTLKYAIKLFGVFKCVI